MQNIDLIAIGKMNAAYFAQGVAEYQKRLGGFCNFRIIELPEVQIADKNASDRQIAKGGGGYPGQRAQGYVSRCALCRGQAGIQ